MVLPRSLLGFAVATAVAMFASSASAQHPDGATLVRLLGARAKDAFAPSGAPGMGGLVRLPKGVTGASLGLPELAPGIARIWGVPSAILAFADAHPELPIEVSPPLHLLLDTAAGFVGATSANTAGHQGKNVLVGLADTGIDLTHPSFLDVSGGTRVQWLLDLSAHPIGKYPDLEQKYGSTDANGNLAFGAVWAKPDIDAALSTGVAANLPKDEVGHGTLVAGCAAGQDPVYRGVAPQAGLLIARITDPGSDSIGNDELLRGVAFLFDRADSMKQPVVVNLSIGTDFGPHDGTLDWEQTLASHVGPGQPGHALIVAAGNSGSISETPIHQNVHVARGSTTRVPLGTLGASQDGGIQVWVAMHPGSDLSVGLEAPGGTWIQPVAPNASAGKNTGSFNAAIYNGSSASGGQIPAQSLGAIVVWQGVWPAGTYAVTLSGLGTADLYVQGTGDASSPGAVGFLDAVRESTINLPATHPDIISVGCTMNKTSWRSVDGAQIGLEAPALDPSGGEPDPTAEPREVTSGEPCWFSSSGPTVTGVPKPEIMAPGAAIIGPLSQQAVPPVVTSVFTTSCPDTPQGPTDKCQEIDATHGVSAGTSFSAPLVAGAVALIFEEDLALHQRPTLTEGDVLQALQGGAHPLRAPALFDDQAGAGELDVGGALSVVDGLSGAKTGLPVASESWMTLGADVYLADGSTPLESVVELRTVADAGGSPEPADGFAAGRLLAYTRVDGSFYSAVPVQRVGPGVWLAVAQLPAGLGGATLTLGVTFDGVDIVAPKSVPIAGDSWSADYPTTARGGCAVAGAGGRSLPEWLAGIFVVGSVVAGRKAGAARRVRRSASG
ncbi:MAG: S8 family serine peptidase [Polyangiaceae bacterium]